MNCKNKTTIVVVASSSREIEVFFLLREKVVGRSIRLFSHPSVHISFCAQVVDITQVGQRIACTKRQQQREQERSKTLLLSAEMVHENEQGHTSPRLTTKISQASISSISLT